MSHVVKSVERWLTSIVIELNLCPFAGREYRSDKVRFKESLATTQEALLQDLVVEMSLLTRRPEIETTLLIHPGVLTDFAAFNQFLSFAESVIDAMSLDGVYQIASFHPDYQFAGTAEDEPENFTNRSPFPILHILREDSLEQAIDSYPDTSEIPERNIELMNSLGGQHMVKLLRKCRIDG